MKILWILIFCCFPISCDVEELKEKFDEEEEESEAVNSTVVKRSGSTSQDYDLDTVDDIRVFMFGNSLLVHEHTPEPSEGKKVPHWLSLFSLQDQVSFRVDGRYGFMRDYSDFSELGPQWGFAQAERLWTDEETPFADVSFNRIIYTPTNFVQYQAPGEAYYDDASTSPLSTTLDTLDQVWQAHPGIPIMIYEGWPDMAGYGNFPEEVDLSRYYADTQESFHQWFINYHNELERLRPDETIAVIPVGPILVKILQLAGIRDLDIQALFEDDAPHGQVTLYFLASLITYSALFQRQIPENYTIPNEINSVVASNYDVIGNLIWDELNSFKDSANKSRVFLNP